MTFSSLVFITVFQFVHTVFGGEPIHHLSKRWDKPSVKLEIMKEKEFSWLDPYSKINPGVQNLMSNPLQHRLTLIGPFLAAHKYFGIDERYSYMKGEEYEKPKFFRHFPIPRLRKLHPSVEEACEKGAIQCLDEIYAKAKISKSTALIHRKYQGQLSSIPDFHPFKSDLEEFQYRVSASYYLCWYTDQQTDVLAYTAGGHCLQNLSLTLEAKNRTVEDFRGVFSGSLMTISPFTCSFLWFCPDPCYGKSSGGNVSSRSTANDDPKNPCKDLKENSCSWVTGKNSNLEDLKRNKFNYTCNCTSEHEGFKWSPLFGICIDRDECYDRDAKCPVDKVCRNTIGSYMCTCRRGFQENLLSGSCTRSQIFKASVIQNIEARPKGETKSAFVTFFERLLGISNGASSQTMKDGCESLLLCLTFVTVFSVFL